MIFLIAYLVRDQRIAEPFLRVTVSQFENKLKAEDESKLSSDDENIAQPVCDVLVVLNKVLEKSWVGEEVGKLSKGLSKSDQRNVSKELDLDSLADSII